MSNQNLTEQVKQIAGVNPRKCMKCGKCSASCPSYDEMDIKPHNFVSYCVNGEFEVLFNSKSFLKCLSCFACIERCPRGVEPAKIINAIKMISQGKREGNNIFPEEVSEKINEELPQQLLVTAFRKYRR